MLTAAYKWNTIKIRTSFWIQKRNVPKTNVYYCIISRLELQIFYLLLSEINLLRVACLNEMSYKKIRYLHFIINER